MLRNHLIASLLLFLFFSWMVCPQELRSEFYGYLDKEGNRHFVDSKEKIPPEYRDQVKVYKERHDDLSEPERRIREEEERLELERRRFEEERRQREWRKAQREWELELRKQEIMRALERETKERERGKRRKERDQGRQGVQKVTILGSGAVGRTVLVPVTLGYRGREIVADLILDTGASMIALHREVADELNIDLRRFKKIRPRVAGGKLIHAYVGRLNYVRAGPIRKENIYVSVIEHQGPAVPFEGLLGMNFLQGLEYRIDFENQLIRWNP